MKTITSLLLAVTLLSSAALADDPQDKDHHPHEDLTKTQLGTVHFPVSCAESVQEPFQRGVALLHSFWYEEAEKEFLGIAKNDPTCAMAHWGVAMSLWHQLWNQPDAKVVARGLSEAKAAEKIRKKATHGKELTSLQLRRFTVARKNVPLTIGQKTTRQP